MTYLLLKDQSKPAALYRYEDLTYEYWDRQVGAWKDAPDLFEDMTGLSGSGDHYDPISKAEARKIVESWGNEWVE